ncbi:MAG TPA: MBL fold metallo-hydrolase [Rhizomicrobium sp.]|jgi:L-ascorbate metabolism protein UlaG (beta-lactamase superfamily)
MATRKFEEFLSIQRLSWAGLFLETNDFTLAIDPPARGLDANEAAPKIVHWGVRETIAADAILITNMRGDRYDSEVIRKILKPDGIVICARESEAKIRRDGFKAHGLDRYQSTALGPFGITALPAVDGLGEVRISFLVELDDIRIIHCGETLWHGYWYKWATDYGPLTVALVPISGALVDLPGVSATHVPAVMTAAQAAAAADVLCAQLVIPTHYGQPADPGRFEEQPNAIQEFEKEARRRSLNYRVLGAGEEIELDRAPPTAD